MRKVHTYSGVGAIRGIAGGIQGTDIMGIQVVADQGDLFRRPEPGASTQLRVRAAQSLAVRRLDTPTSLH